MSLIHGANMKIISTAIRLNDFAPLKCCHCLSSSSFKAKHALSFSFRARHKKTEHL